MSICHRKHRRSRNETSLRMLLQGDVPRLSLYRMLQSPQFLELCRLFEYRRSEADLRRFTELTGMLERTFR